MVSRRQVLQMVSGVTAAALAGCFGGGDPPGSGDGGDGGDNGTTEPAGRVVTTQAFSVIGTSTAAREFPDYDWNILEDPDPVDTNEVTMTETYDFDPQVVRVPPGTTVSIENSTNQFHTVTVPKLGFDQQVLSGSAAEVTFEEAGVYNYLCRNHPPDMIGRVIVDETLASTSESDGTDTDGGMGGTETSG
jgi:plastocyanin